jgi:L-aminopeptidase/D-esterase-like protein
VKEQHVVEALSSARPGPVAEGPVGGGTGMVCHGFKGGIGTSSRRLDEKAGGHIVGVIVQANHGTRNQLRVAGVPVGRELTVSNPRDGDWGSIIIIVATDAPLLPHQLKRLARRASLGVARNGAISGNGSGDIFIAFSTANPGAFDPSRNVSVTMVPNGQMDRLFEATVQATEESIINALVAGRTMTGIDNHTVIGLPHDKLREILKKYNRLVER